MLSEKCGRCGASQFLEVDERHGHYARKCVHGHTNGYVDLEGKETPIRDTDLPKPSVHDPKASPLLSTREWVRDTLGEALLDDIEGLEEGTYGRWDDRAGSL